MEIIPVLNCIDKHEAEEKIKVLATFLSNDRFVHIDIADGIFTFHRTWNDTKGWEVLGVPFPLEVHLMVEDPQAWIGPWIAAGAKRFVLQIETIDPDILAGIKKECEASGVEVMLSLNPETPPEDLTPYLQDTSRFQVLCVNPGLAGQKFLSLTLEKAVWIRYAVPHAIIEIDGGITPETARLAKNAGANIIVSASYIFGSDDPERAYEELKKI